MSRFVGAALPTNIHIASDERLNRMGFQPEKVFADIWAVAAAPFSPPGGWWPGGGFVGDLGADVAALAAEQWGDYDQAAGASSRFGFVGVTRDAYGSLIGGCTVRLYLTADGSLIDSTTSDASGNFLLNTPYYPNTHYLVAHKAGTPDVGGSTPNTMVGT